MTKLTKTQQELATFLDRVFADGVVEPAERDALRKVWQSGGLTGQEVFAVLDAFVTRLWNEASSDGEVTDEDRTRLRAVVDGLHIPDSMLPDRLREAIGRDGDPTAPT